MNNEATIQFANANHGFSALFSRHFEA